MKKFVLDGKLYDMLKWVLLIVTPAFMTLLTTIGKIWGLDTTNIVLTIEAVAVFLGALIGLSNYNYYKDRDEK